MTNRILAQAASLTSEILLVDSKQLVTDVTKNSITIDKPATTTGDYLVAYVATPDSGANPTTGSWTAPAGWTRLFSSSKLPNLDIYYKVATSSEPTTYTWSFSRSNFYLAATIFSFRNVADIGFLGSTNISTGTFNTQNAPGGTIDFSRSYALVSYFNTNDTLTFTPPAGYDIISTISGFGGGGGVGTLGFGTTGTGSSLSSLFATKLYTSFTISSATASLDFDSSESAESAQIYLLDKNKVTLLSSYSQNFGTVGLNQTLTTNQITVSAVGDDNTITCPAGVTFDKNLSGSFASSGTFQKNDVLRFRLTSSGSYNTAPTSTITVGVTKFTITHNTNNYALYTSSGTFTVPTGVTSVSFLALGAGGGGHGFVLTSGAGLGGAGGGALSYTNNYTVSGGQVYTVTVGNGGVGGNAGAGGTAGGDSSVTIGGTTVVLAQGGRGRGSQTSAGAAGGVATSGVGAVRRNGGAGADSTSYYTNGESGGGGGGAATPAADGPTGLFDLTQNSSMSGGRGGQGTTFSSTGWGTVATAYTSGYAGGNGQQRGGGGGSSYVYNQSRTITGGDGGGGAVVIVWGGRTFTSGTTY